MIIFLTNIVEIKNGNHKCVPNYLDKMYIRFSKISVIKMEVTLSFWSEALILPYKQKGEWFGNDRKSMTK
jgi:hypothetical protein